MTDYTLVIGNKNFSSWSMRPWLVMKATGAKFTEINVKLRTPESKADILKHSPSGQVPALKFGGTTVWDSLAICETLAEHFPNANLWPTDAAARAHARSICAEMHSGFAALRQKHQVDMTARTPKPMDDDVKEIVTRIQQLWREARAHSGRGKGNYLYGAFSIADAFYAPVVSRFVTYDIPVAKDTREYMDVIWNHPAFAEWYKAAEKEVA